MATSHTTTDRAEIKKWAEARKGKPSAVKSTRHDKNAPGITRLDFPSD